MSDQTPPVAKPTSHTRNATSRWGVPALILTATAAASVIGGVITVPAVRGGWYDTLVKPSWTPPNAAFGPVWTALYIAMAVAALRVWTKRERANVRLPLAAYFVQIALNATWSVLFFGLRNPPLALGEIVLLLAAVIGTTVLFARASRLAGGLFVPYAVWVAFAAGLNAGIVLLNR